MKSNRWTVSGKIATLEGRFCRWEIDLARPQAGIRVEAKSTLGRILQVDPLPQHTFEIDDWFARDSDVMVRYCQTASDQFGFQVDLRSLSVRPGDAFQDGLDAWISVQTQWLESHPVISLCSHWNDAVWSTLDEDGQLSNDHPSMLSAVSSAGSLVLMIHPSDREQTQVQADTLRLFGQFMEKGVIRRARLRCLVSDGSVAQPELAKAYRNFADSPLPLTT